MTTLVIIGAIITSLLAMIVLDLSRAVKLLYVIARNANVVAAEKAMGKE